VSKCHAEATRSAAGGKRDLAASGVAQVRAGGGAGSADHVCLLPRRTGQRIDDIFVATNLVLLLAAFVGLTAFGVFFDIFAAIGFVSLYFGLCRLYARVQRGRAIGNNDFRSQFDPVRDRVLPSRACDSCPIPRESRALERRLREYRRRLRRYVHGGLDAVMLDGWSSARAGLGGDGGRDRARLVGARPATAAAAAERELDGLHAHLIAHDDVLPDDGSVHVPSCSVKQAIRDTDFFEVRAKVRGTLGRLLAERTEWPLSARIRCPPGSLNGGIAMRLFMPLSLCAGLA
jgi:hypothetical protein